MDDSSDNNPGNESNTGGRSAPSLLAQPDASERKRFELQFSRPIKIGLVIAGIALAAAGLLTSSFWQNEDTSKTSSEGLDSSEIKDRKVVGDFELTDADGKKVPFAAYKGKVVIMSFWNRECTNCLMDLLTLAQIQKKFGADKLAIVPVNVDSAPEAKGFAKEYWAKSNYEFQGFFDPAQQIATQLGVETIPASFVMDREGRIVLTGVGMTDWNDSETFAIVEGLVNEK